MKMRINSKNHHPLPEFLPADLAVEDLLSEHSRFDAYNLSQNDEMKNFASKSKNNNIFLIVLPIHFLQLNFNLESCFLNKQSKEDIKC